MLQRNISHVKLSKILKRLRKNSAIATSLTMRMIRRGLVKSRSLISDRLLRAWPTNYALARQSAIKKTIQETAIEILYRDYGNRLDTGAFVDAVNVPRI
ncbi:hypothetical protein V1506DRAFT_543380 [Lipomyces tetrasporus]